MEREQIVREDFPTARKGWSPEAVRVHLIAVADAFPDEQPTPTPAATATSGRVESVIAAAEEAAAEIIGEAEAEADRMLGAAQAEAEQIRAAARSESEQTVTAANREATGRIEQARGAVEGLIAQADKLRAQVGALGKDLASSMPGSSTDDPDAPEDPLSVPDVAPEPVAPEAARPSAPASAPPSNEDLIERLRGAPSEPEPEPEPSPAISGSDLGAARLVAMNMALDGAPREKIAKQISAEFGEVEDVGALLDDVLRRADR